MTKCDTLINIYNNLSNYYYDDNEDAMAGTNFMIGLNIRL